MFMSGGKIHLIGLGPGDRALLTPAAAGALERCDVVVGYDGYIEQVRDLVEGKQVISMPLGKEMERAAKAAELANALACRLAVISSGDIGVYGMAGPVFEHLAANGWDGEASPSRGCARGVCGAVCGVRAWSAADAGLLRD